MTEKNANSKRRKERKCEDEFDLLESSPESALDYGEKVLWCTIIRANVELARRGNDNATFWLHECSGVFETVCSLLGLDAPLIRSAANALSVKHSRIRGMSFNGSDAPRKARKATAPALPAPRPAVAAPLDGLSHGKIALESSRPVSSDPAPVTSDDWVTGPYVIQFDIPIPKRGRRTNAA
jgi:hypothetical protein